MFSPHGRRSSSLTIALLCALWCGGCARDNSLITRADWDFIDGRSKAAIHGLPSDGPGPKPAAKPPEPTKTARRTKPSKHVDPFLEETVDDEPLTPAKPRMEAASHTCRMLPVGAELARNEPAAVREAPHIGDEPLVRVAANRTLTTSRSEEPAGEEDPVHDDDTLTTAGAEEPASAEDPVGGGRTLPEAASDSPPAEDSGPVPAVQINPAPQVELLDPPPGSDVNGSPQVVDAKPPEPVAAKPLEALASKPPEPETSRPPEAQAARPPAEVESTKPEPVAAKPPKAVATKRLKVEATRPPKATAEPLPPEEPAAPPAETPREALAEPHPRPYPTRLTTEPRRREPEPSYVPLAAQEARKFATLPEARVERTPTVELAGEIEQDEFHDPEGSPFAPPETVTLAPGETWLPKPVVTHGPRLVPQEAADKRVEIPAMEHAAKPEVDLFSPAPPEPPTRSKLSRTSRIGLAIGLAGLAGIGLWRLLERRRFLAAR